MHIKGYKEVLYTIEVDCEAGIVWINNHVSKEKIMLTKKDSDSIAYAFFLMSMNKKTEYNR